MSVTVRYFAAARVAAGTECENVDVSPGTTVAELIAALGARDAELARVLGRCSFLCDGVAVRNLTMGIAAGRSIDVLPPFAGG